MDEALVEHAQQQVDHQDRQPEQHELAGLRVLEHCGVAAVGADQRAGHLQLAHVAVELRRRCAERDIRRQVEAQRHRLQLALVVHCRRADGALHGGERAQRHQCAGLAAQRDLVERVLELLVALGRLHQYLVGVAGRVDGRDLPLAESAVEGTAQIGHRHAEQRGLVTVDLQAGLQAALLRVAGDVAEQRVVAQLALQLAGPLVERVGAHALQRVLVAALALAPAELQVLHRAHEDLHAGEAAGLLAQVVDHLGHGRALAARMQRDEQAAGVLGRATAAARERGDRADGRVLLEDARDLGLHLEHGLEGDVFRRLDRHLQLPDVLLGEEALGDLHEQHRGGHEGAQREQQHHPAV